MKSLFKVLFSPTGNRYYTNKRTSALIYAARLLPVVLLVLMLALTENALYWLALIFVLLFSVAMYLNFDSQDDKIAWKLYGKRWYEDKEKDGHKAEYAAMKKFESEQSPESYRELYKRLTSK